MKLGLILVVLFALMIPAISLAGNSKNNRVVKTEVCLVEHGREVASPTIPSFLVPWFLAIHPDSYVGDCDGRTTNPTPTPTPTPTPVLTVANVPHDNNIALCYSVFQTDPLWSNGYADAVADVTNFGWTEPVAVLGNVVGGTNVGAYYLTCQKSGTPTGSFVGGSGGATFGPEYASLANSALGFYAIVQ